MAAVNEVRLVPVSPPAKIEAALELIEAVLALMAVVRVTMLFMFLEIPLVLALIDDD